MKIIPTEINDLDFCCHLFQEAIAYQKRKGYPQYIWDDREVQKKYILNGTHFKVVLRNEIVAMFNLQDADPIVWREMDQGNSIYLHGVLINPKFKGQRIVGRILDWSVNYSRNKEKTEIRIDTWFDNPPLTDYYQTFGFQMVEGFQIPCSDDTPLNCRGNKVALMEYKFPYVHSYHQGEIDHVIQGFENQTLEESKWTHHAHLMVSLHFCLKYDMETALNQLREKIKKYNACLGGINDETQGYHETITKFWIDRTNYFMNITDNNNFYEMCNLYINSHLGHSKSPWWFYEKKTLDSVSARMDWVVPDKFSTPHHKAASLSKA